MAGRALAPTGNCKELWRPLPALRAHLAALPHEAVLVGLAPHVQPLPGHHLDCRELGQARSSTHGALFSCKTRTRALLLYTPVPCSEHEKRLAA